MACQALHSHLLLGLMMIHAAIIVYLFVSEMYILYPHKTSTSTDITPTKTTVASPSSKENDLDINGDRRAGEEARMQKPSDAYQFLIDPLIRLLGMNARKLELVIVAMGAHIVCFINVIGALVVNNVTAAARRLPPSVIVVTLIFSLIFNVAGALCLWLHDAPHHPGGISRTVRGCMILSFTTIGYTAIVMVVYCARSPKHDSLRGHSAEAIQSDQLSREKTKSKEKGEQKSKDEDKSKKAKKDVQLEPSPVDYWSNPAPEGTK
ncbi:hypothetical protein GCK32_000874, partial [Trichostrongylus colubriformis]